MSHCNNILNKVIQNSKFQKNVTNIIQNIVCYSQDTYPSWSFDKNNFLYFAVTQTGGNRKDKEQLGQAEFPGGCDEVPRGAH